MLPWLNSFLCLNMIFLLYSYSLLANKHHYFSYLYYELFIIKMLILLKINLNYLYLYSNKVGSSILFNSKKSKIIN